MNKVQLTSDIYTLDSTFQNLLASQINVIGKIPVIDKYPLLDYVITKSIILTYAGNALIEDNNLFVTMDNKLEGGLNAKFTPVLSEDETKIIAIKYVA